MGSKKKDYIEKSEFLEKAIEKDYQFFKNSYADEK